MAKLLILLILFSVSSMVAAGDRLDLSEPASGDGLVKVIGQRGELRIEGWDQDIVAVTGELDDLAEELVFLVEDGKTLIEVKMPSRVSWGDGSDLLIRIPQHSRLVVNAVSSEVEIRNVLGGMIVKTVSGDVHIQDSKARLVVNSVSGDIETEATMGTLQLQTSSGEVEVEKHAGELSAESVSGQLSLELSEITALRGNSVSGDIEVSAILASAAYVELVSISGDVKLGISGAKNLRFQLSSQSGDIDNDLTDDKYRQRYGAKKLNGTLGNGEADVTMRTVSGDIEIE